MTRTGTATETDIADILEAHAGRPGALLPILRDVQERLGCVPPAHVAQIAHALNLSRAEVHGVVSFYPDLRSEPPGRHVVQVCRAEACQALKGQQTERHAKSRLGIEYHETTADGAVTLEPVHCLGNCAAGPSVMIDHTLHGRVTPERLDELLDELLHERPDDHGDDQQDLQSSAQLAQPVGRSDFVTTRRLYISCDSSARALGADATVQALQRAAKATGVELDIRRVGTRGMTWLEPLVEIEDASGRRIAYGPVQARDVPDLVARGLFDAAPHALRHGPVEDIPYFARQQRLTFARVGLVDPSSLDDYLAHGGFEGLHRALAVSGAEVVQEVIDSGLRGRGGAAFPTGIKWRTVLEQTAQQKYVVCNADEGDSGTFAERMLLEGDPFCLIEGMVIAGIAVGATSGFVYVRSEYPDAVRTLRHAVDIARRAGYVGADVCGSGRAFELELRVGAGAYICGEETSLLESLEGRRAEVRYRPPLPAIQGLFACPTVINNGLSLAAVPDILRRGAAWYRDFGMGRSRGTMPWQLAGNVRRGGLIELAFGVTLRELLYDFGGGSLSGRPIRAVQDGGPLGAYLPETQFDTPLDYEAFAAIDAMVGHGGIVAFDDTVDMAQMARYAFEFCAHESCGKCAPCRIGSTRGVEVMDRILRGENRVANLAQLGTLCETMQHGSLCGLGGMTPVPVMSAIRHFPGDFARDR